MEQFQDILETMKDLDEDPTEQRQKSLENKYNEFRQNTDKDLDDQLYADQLDTLLKRISPDSFPNSFIAPKQPMNQKKIKMPDEDKIMDIIHGTYKEEVVAVKPRKRQVQKVPVAPPHHFGGIPPFGMPPNSSGRAWGQTVVSIRKADGSFETRKTERTPDGQTKTTITKTDSDGSSLTQTFTGDGSMATAKALPELSREAYAERNLVTVNGYKVPCLW